MTRRRRLYLIALWLPIVLCWWPGESRVAEAQVVSARAGVVTRAEGEVFYQPSGEKDSRRLQAGVRFGGGDAVITARGARAEWSLTPDSYLQVGPDSSVRIYELSSGQLHFDVERGEVYVIVRSLEKGTSLVVHAPPGLLTVYKRGRYRVRVAAGGDTDAAVAEGELRYADAKGNLIRVGKRKEVHFFTGEKKIVHGP